MPDISVDSASRSGELRSSTFTPAAYRKDSHQKVYPSLRCDQLPRRQDSRDYVCELDAPNYSKIQKSKILTISRFAFVFGTPDNPEAEMYASRIHGRFVISRSVPALFDDSDCICRLASGEHHAESESWSMQCTPKQSLTPLVSAR